MSTPKITQELLQKYQQNQCTPEEQAAIESWYNDVAKQRARAPLDEESLMAVDVHLRSILKDKLIDRRASTQRSMIWKVAAALLVTLTVSSIFLLYRSSTKPETLTVSNQPTFSPGIFRATVSHGNERPASNQYSSNVLTMDHQSTKNSLSVETAKGEEFKIVLADGTEVWMNAASKIHVPEKFNLNDRTVFLEGEAYFKVAKNKAKPFIVHVADLTVQALGTEFNIQYYNHDTKSIKTFLVEGSVQLNQGKTQTLLKPGELFEIDIQTGEHARTIISDPPKLYAWKDGYFEFDNTPIADILQNLSKWYNFQYEIAPSYSHKTLTGKIARKQSFDDVLKILKFSGINYQISDGLLRLSPKS